MNQDEKMVLLIVQESLVEGDASPARQKDLATMLERVISGGLTSRAADGATWESLGAGFIEVEPDHSEGE